MVVQLNETYFKSTSKTMKDIIIIGGGLAGIINAIQLSRAGFEVLLIEKGAYPAHKVCGEYVSNEVLPFLNLHDIFPVAFEPPHIDQFQLSDNQGKSVKMSLQQGGFGISRFLLDDFLYKKALASGTSFLLNTQVEDVCFEENAFRVSLRKGDELMARIVIGAYGKRSRLDKNLDRDFISKRTPFIGVKYHVKADFPRNLVALHNFEGGYCGIGAIENGLTNICYLGNKHSLRAHGSIEEMERQVLYKNPFLKEIFSQATFVFEKPEVINEVSFASKSVVHHHILMSGDTAGLISPLCGNGMAMAIRSAKMLSALICKHYKKGSFDRQMLEKEYTHAWRDEFAWRLWYGRNTQKLFGNKLASSFLVGLARNASFVANIMVKQSHGKPF